MITRRAALALATGLGGCARGTVQVFADALPIAGLDRRRTLRVYLPPSYASEPARRYPLLVLHDGQNLFDRHPFDHERWGVDSTLDALAASDGFEAVAVGIDHGGEQRIAEMLPAPTARFTRADGDAYADFVVGGVLPWAEQRFRVEPGAASRAIGGSSLGAVISQHVLQRHPGRFGRALLFSPAYWTAQNLFAHAQATALPRGTRIAFVAGTEEGDTMIPLMQRMHELLASRGTAVIDEQILAGARHHEATWRRALEPTLRWLFELQVPKKK